MQAITRKCFPGAIPLRVNNSAPDRAVLLACPKVSADEAEIRGAVSLDRVSSPAQTLNRSGVRQHVKVACEAKRTGETIVRRKASFGHDRFVTATQDAIQS